MEEDKNPENSKKNLQMHITRASESDSSNSWKESMEQEGKQMCEKFNELCARVEELHQSGSQEDVKKGVDLEAKLSEFQKEKEKYRNKIDLLLYACTGKLKEVASIILGAGGEKSGFIGKEYEARQTDHPETLKKHKLEHELVSSYNEDSSKDFSKKLKTDTDCSNNEVLLDVEALHQEKYKSVVDEIEKGEGVVEGLKLKEQSTVGETQKGVDQSEDQLLSGCNEEVVKDESQAG